MAKLPKMKLQLPKFKNVMPKTSTQLIRVILIAALIVLISYAIYLLLTMQCGAKTKEGFESNSETYYLIYIYSSSCPHCKTFMPIFDEAAQDLSQRNIKSLKFEASEKGAQQYLDMVHGFPTVLLFKDDTYVKNFVGSQPKEKLMAFVNEHVPL